jgi:hypothetical protein
MSLVLISLLRVRTSTFDSSKGIDEHPLRKKIIKIRAILVMEI